MKNILDLIKGESDTLKEQEERDANYRKKVIDAFFEYGKLKSIPAQRKKKELY